MDWDSTPETSFFKDRLCRNPVSKWSHLEDLGVPERRNLAHIVGFEQRLWGHPKMAENKNNGGKSKTTSGWSEASAEEGDSKEGFCHTHVLPTSTTFENGGCTQQ